MMIAVIPFLSLIILGFSGLFLMGWGIKNFTKAQTACIRANLKGQEALGQMLKQLLNLNRSSKSLSGKRKKIQKAMAVALVSGNFPALSLLKKALGIIKLRQKLLIVQQKILIVKSQALKRKALKNFRLLLLGLKVKNIYELTAFKKALAVQRKQIGEDAYVYVPKKNFSEAQKITFLWRLNPLAGSDEKALRVLSATFKYFGRYSCSATLKQNGKAWEARLSL